MVFSSFHWKIFQTLFYQQIYIWKSHFNWLNFCRHATKINVSHLDAKGFILIFSHSFIFETNKRRCLSSRSQWFCFDQCLVITPQYGNHYVFNPHSKKNKKQKWYYLLLSLTFPLSLRGSCCFLLRDYTVDFAHFWYIFKERNKIFTFLIASSLYLNISQHAESKALSSFGSL